MVPETSSWDVHESELHFAAMARDFIEAGVEEAGHVIELGLERARAWTGCERIDLDLLPDSLGDPTWSASSSPASETRVWSTAIVLENRDEYGWLNAKLADGVAVPISRLDDLPPSATSERALFARSDRGARLLIPVVVKGRLFGCLTLEHASHDRTWPPLLVGRLRTLAEVYASVAQRDMSDRARRRAELRFDTLAHFSRNIVCEFDTSGELTFVSPSIRDILGVEPEAALGLGFLDLVHPDDRARAAEALRLDAGLPFEDVDVRLRRSDGQYIWVEAEGSSFPGAGGPRRILAVLRDVTERRGRQAELKDQLDIEREVTRLSRELVGLESASLAETFRNALGAAATIAGCDQAYAVGAVTDRNAGVPGVHFWGREGLEADAIVFDAARIEEFGWLLREIETGHPVVLSDVETLPEDAIAERAEFRAREIRSFLGLPLRDGPRIVGLICFVSIRRSITWSDHQLSMLRLVAELFGAVFRRVRAEEHLREREERFRVLADQSPEPIIEVTDRGQIVFASADFAGLLGDPEEDWVGRYLVDFVVPAEIQRINRLSEIATASGQSVPPSVFECRHADGTPRFLEASVRRFESVTGRTHGLATLRDVTARLESERTLEQQIKLERQIVQISSDFLGRSDDELEDGVRRAMGIVAHLARADRCTLIAFKPQPGFGLEVYEWYAEGLPEKSREPMDLVSEPYPSLTRKVLRGERFLVSRVEDLPASAAAERAAMERRGLKSFLLIPFMAQSKLAGVFMLSSLTHEEAWNEEDLTILNLASDILHGALRRRYAALELEESQLQLLQSQKMEAVGTLAGGIAHDFNNQLAVMLGNARYVLERQVEPGDTRDALLDLERAAEHCAQLTRSLLTFSRHAVQELRTIAVSSWLAEVGELVKPLLPASIDLEVDVADGIGAVRGDETQLQQVVVNLLVNARDAMPRGGRIRVNARRTRLAEKQVRRLSLRSPDVIELDVEDDGVGMSDDVRARVFEPFFTTKAMGKGTGLGLATVYGIVQQYGGGIEVESTPGEGARFRVYLPAYEEVSTPRDSDPAGAPAALRSFDTILLVEDEPAVRRIVRRMLDSRAKRVIEARDGLDALEKMANHRGEIDLLVTDMVMPRMGGLALARRIVETQPDLPMLFLSGYPDDELDFEHEPLRHHRFLQKPFTERDLTKAMESLLPMHRETDDPES